MSGSRGTIDRDSLRAHAEWIRLDRQGVGQLDVAGIEASGTNLQAAKLAAVRLDRVDLRKASLDYADLTDAELTQCTFDDAGINSTHFDNARITDCSFVNATGEIVHLDRSHVSGSRFDGAKLHTSKWSSANVKATRFTNTVLANATFDSASFVDCDFRGAWLGPLSENPPHSMHATRFVNCDFRGADFTRANLDGATFERCKFEGARGQPKSTTGLSVIESDLGSQDQVLTALAECLSVDAILAHPGVLVAARDGADPLRTAVFVVDRSARLLARVPLNDALARLRQGATYGHSGIVWTWNDESFTIWDTERKALEVRGDSLSWPGGPLERKLVTSVASFINPDRLGNRGLKLVMPEFKHGRIVIVQDNDFAADNNPAYTRDDARRDGAWASHVGRYLAQFLGVPHTDELA